MSWFGRVVSALAYSLAQNLVSPDEPLLAAPYNDTARFVEGQIGRMSSPLIYGIKSLTLAFDICAWARCGSLFHRLRHADRMARIEAWRRSPWPACRQFVRLYESLTAYGIYARLEAAAETPRA